jgi:hypothetical protein
MGEEPMDNGNEKERQCVCGKGDGVLRRGFPVRVVQDLINFFSPRRGDDVFVRSKKGDLISTGGAKYRMEGSGLLMVGAAFGRLEGH